VTGIGEKLPPFLGLRYTLGRRTCLRRGQRKHSNEWVKGGNMESKKMICPECGGEMEEGYIVDASYSGWLAGS